MKNQKQEFAELDRALDEFLEKRKAAGQEIKTADDEAAVPCSKERDAEVEASVAVLEIGASRARH